MNRPDPAPLSDQGGRDGLVGREAAMTDLPLVCHLAVVFLWHSALFHKHSQWTCLRQEPSV